MQLLAVLAFGMFVGYLLAVVLFCVFARNGRAREDELEEALIAIEQETRVPCSATIQRVRTLAVETLQ